MHVSPIARSRDVAKTPLAPPRQVPVIRAPCGMSVIVTGDALSHSSQTLLSHPLMLQTPQSQSCQVPSARGLLPPHYPTRKALQKHPFLLFGLPFMATIVAGSFMLTPATALRYERYDRKNQQITQEEAMGLRQERRKVNMKDEYYVCTRCDADIGTESLGYGAARLLAVH
jgi:hypothetical protein